MSRVFPGIEEVFLSGQRLVMVRAVLNHFEWHVDWQIGRKTSEGLSIKKSLYKACKEIIGFPGLNIEF